MATKDEIQTTQHKRIYVQWGGGKPGQDVRYAGEDGQYMVLEGVSNPESGGTDPIWAPDPDNIKKYKLIGTSASPPEMPTATLLLREKHGVLPKQLTYIGCPFNIYEVSGKCKNLGDFLHGWSDYVQVYSGAIISGKDLGSRTAWDSDDAIEDSLELTLTDIYPVGPLNFGVAAGSQIDLEVIDVVYQSTVECGDCGPYREPHHRIYWLTKSSAGSPGLPAEVIYTTDGGSTFGEMNIDGMSETEDPLGIDIVGEYLIVIGGSVTPTYYYSKINTDSGVPGAWTAVTSGFTAGTAPNDTYVKSTRNVFFASDGGYVYKATSITSGVSVLEAGIATSENLLRIDGDYDQTIVAGGENGALIISDDGGRIWASVPTSPTSDNIQALGVKNKYEFWVGTAAGEVFYTLDGGNNWTELIFAESGNGQIYDIVWLNSDVGFILYTDVTPTAKILTTWNGGADWLDTAEPRIINWPTFTRANRIAYPHTHASIGANNVAIAGLSAGGTDGIALIGEATRE